MRIEVEPKCGESVIQFVLRAYEWMAKDKLGLYCADDLRPIITALRCGDPIEDLYYADVVEDHFIFDPREAREVDPLEFKITKEFYEYGKMWFFSMEGYKEEFEEIYEISWERAMNEWADQYVSQKWIANDWAGYMLDRIEDLPESSWSKMHAILEWK